MRRVFLTAILGLILLSTASATTARADDHTDHDLSEIEYREDPEFDYFNHGFRLGYMMIMNHDCAVVREDSSSCQNIKEDRGLVVPHTMFVGYELTQRLRGSDWLNVIFVENIMFAGIEQSAVLPSFNLLIGFEFLGQIQLDFGANLIPSATKTAHMIAALGWTPDVGSFQMPLHAFIIPDVDGQHRLGLSMGVNW